MKREEHIINLGSGGRLSQSGEAVASRAQIAGILAAYAASGKPSMTIHFHGGLVSEGEGLQQAEKLFTEISENCQSYPVFVVWQSGALEVLQASLLDVVQGSPLFRQVLQKLLKHVLRKFPALGEIVPDHLLDFDLELAPAEGVAIPVATIQAVDAARADALRAQIEAERLPAVDPEALLLLEPADWTALGDVSDAEIAALETDLAADAEAQRALSSILANVAPLPAGDLELAPAEPTAATGYVSNSLLQELRAKQPPAGVDAEFAVVATVWAFAGRILKAVIGRYQARTDHGLLGTTLEEIYRTVYADKVGAFIWDAIKANAREAYVDNAAGAQDAEMHGMTLFLDLFAEQVAERGMPRLNLVGHSAGAIHICHFVERGVRVLGEKFALASVVLTAPACTCDLFFRTISPNLGRIAALRIFDMADELERRDPLVKWLPIAYPHSLLYLVSGLLEARTDESLLGLARHIAMTRPNDKREDDSAAVRALLVARAGSLVLAKTAADAPVEERATFTSHYGEMGPLGDRATLDAIAALIRPAPATDLPPLEATITQEIAPLLQPSRAVMLGQTPEPGALSVDDLLALQLGGGPAAIAPSGSAGTPAGNELDELSPLEMDNLLEALIGENDLVDHAIVKGLLNAGKSVARIITSGVKDLEKVAPAERQAKWQAAVDGATLGRYFGTGWVFGSARRLFMTNNHVLPLIDAARSARCEFGYERDLRSGARAQRVLSLDPDAFFLTSPNLGFGGLDYTLVALGSAAANLPPEELGFLEPIQGITASTADNIYIVQHPQGNPKTYVLNHNRKVNLTDKYVTYISDTLGGSSGSPLFNDQCRLVGIHHLGNYAVTIGTRTELTNLGSRIEVILADIVAQLKERAFTDEQVLAWFGRGALYNLWRR